MLNLNEPIKIGYLWKLANQFNVQWRTCHRNGKQFFLWKHEKLWSFDISRNVLIKKKKKKKKNRDMGSEN